MAFLPYLTTLFFFVFFCNIFEIIPLIQFPATARMAIPLILALIAWVTYIVVGFKRQGSSYLSTTRLPAGRAQGALLSWSLRSSSSRRSSCGPFSLAVRLFANMLAGHLLLVTFAVLTDALLFTTSHASA